jgi:hypothetical protein
MNVCMRMSMCCVGDTNNKSKSDTFILEWCHEISTKRIGLMQKLYS